MTIQVRDPAHGKSKAALQAALDAAPSQVWFHDPSIMHTRCFAASSMAPGESFPVVMDHPKRMRFATVSRLRDGAYRVG